MAELLSFKECVEEPWESAWQESAKHTFGIHILQPGLPSQGGEGTKKI